MSFELKMAILFYRCTDGAPFTSILPTKYNKKRIKKNASDWLHVPTLTNHTKLQLMYINKVKFEVDFFAVHFSCE